MTSRIITRWGTTLAKLSKITMYVKSKSINNRTKVSWELMGKCRRTAMALRCYLRSKEGSCVYVCVWRVHALVCVRRRAVWYEGSRAACWKVPRGTGSRLVPMHFPERIVFFLSEEERPAQREMGPKCGKPQGTADQREANFSPTLRCGHKNICGQSRWLDETEMKGD